MGILTAMANFANVSDPILDLSAAPLRDSSVTDITWSEYQPQNPAARQLLELVVNNTDQYTLPSEAYLQVAGKLVKAADGTNYAAADVVSLVNNGIMALFESASYRINGQEVETLNQNVDVATTILGLVRYSDDYAKSTGTSMFWAKDMSTAANIAPYATVNVQSSAAGNAATAVVRGKNVDYNHGFHIRHGLLLGGGNTGFFEAVIPLSHIFGFCRDVRKVLYGVKHELKLQRRATDVEAIYRAAGAVDGRVDLTKVSLWMPTVTPSLEWQATLERWMTAKKTTTLYWQATQVDQSAEQAAITDFVWKLAVRSGAERPRHVFIAFQLTAKRNSQEQNPMIFDALTLSDIHLKLNATRVPVSDLDMNFAERRFQRAYKMLADYMGRDQDVDTGFQISCEDFRTLYPIYHFDLEAQSERLMDSITDLYVRARFSANPGNYKAYAVVQSDRTMLLSSDGRKMNLLSST